MEMLAEIYGAEVDTHGGAQKVKAEMLVCVFFLFLFLGWKSSHFGYHIRTMN